MTEVFLESIQISENRKIINSKDNHMNNSIIFTIILSCLVFVGLSEKCQLNCDKCYQNKCQSCKNGFYLAIDNFCKECPFQCSVCSVREGSKVECGLNGKKYQNEQESIYRIKLLFLDIYLRAYPEGTVDLVGWDRQWEQWRFFKQANGNYNIISFFGSSLTPDIKQKRVYLSKYKNFTEWEVFPSFIKQQVSTIAYNGLLLGGRINSTVYLDNTMKNGVFWSIQSIIQN